MFLIAGVLQAKKKLPKVDRSAQIPKVKPFTDPGSHFEFCRQYNVAGGEQVPPAP